MTHNLTTHYLRRLAGRDAFLRSDVLLTVEHYGPRGPHTRLGIAAKVVGS